MSSYLLNTSHPQKLYIESDETRRSEVMKNFQRTLVPFYLCVLGLIFVFSGLSSQQTAGELFEKALYIEEAQGDLQKAIGLYQDILKQFSDNRDVAAQTQLHIGLCYEKLGLREAQKAFQKVVDNYPEQTEAVKIAKEKLDVLLRAQAIVENGRREMKVTKIYESTEKGTGFLSPDGKKIALVDFKGDIWLRDVTSAKETRLTQTPSYKYWCFWSPDSETIAYLDVLNGLYVVPAKGGEPRALVKSDSEFIKSGNFAWPTGWTADSQMITCHVSQRGLCAIPISGGEWKDIYKFPDQDEEKNVGIMALSPDGKLIAYDSKKSGNQDLFVIPVGGGLPIQITDHPESDSSPKWSPDGKYLSFTSTRTGDNSIWAVKISPDGHPEGEPLQVFRGLFSRNAYYDWVGEGKIGICLGAGISNIFMTDLETGKETQLTNILAMERHPRWSPDGQKIAFISQVSGNDSFWLIPSEGRKPIPVTLNVPNANEQRYVTRPTWLPDGKAILFGGFFGRDVGIWIVPAEGGVPQKLKFDEFEAATQVCDVSPDGAYIAFDYSASETVPEKGKEIKGSRAFGSDIYVIPFKGGTPKRITNIEKEGLGFRYPRWSPDGKKIVFNSLDWLEYNEGRDSEEIYVCSFPEGEPKPITKKMKANLVHLCWSPDGKTIFFSMMEKNQPQLYAISSDGGEMKKLNIEGSSPDISPDGKKMVFARRTSNKVEYLLVENFLGMKQ